MKNPWTTEDSARLGAKAIDLIVDAVASLSIWRQLAGSRAYLPVESGTLRATRTGRKNRRNQ